MKLKIVLFIIILSTSFYAQDDGTLNTSFDTDGKLTTNFVSNADDYGVGVSIQSDGKIIVAGYTDYDQGQILIARYNSDGSLDNTFGTSGKVSILRPDLTGTALYNIYITDVGIKSDGKIVLCGHGYKSGATYEDFYIFQFTNTGALDVIGFGNNGYTVTDVSGKTDYANALAIQADDKIIVTGYGDGNFVAVRYTSGGILDTDFATSGIYIGSAGTAYCIDITDNGIIFLGGASGHDFGIIKLDSQGTIDNLFATGGLLVINFGASSEMCYSLTNDGTSVYAGGGAMPGWSIAKFSISNGSMDNSFDTDGKLTTKLSTGQTSDYINSISIQTDGKIIAAGTVSRYYSSFYSTVFDFAVARFNNIGTFDNTFNSTGKTQFNFNSVENYIYDSKCKDMIQEPGGDIIMAGYGIPSISISYRDFCVAKINNATSPTPVELQSFSAKLSENTIILNWQTATEINNYGFEIERKANDNWENIGFIDGHGNSNSPKDYSFVDDNPLGNIISYRLKQIDTDGSFEYSEIVTVTSELPLEYKLSQNFPNPFNPSTTIEFALPQKANVSLKVYNSIGEEVVELINNELIMGYHSVNFNATNLSSGIYFYRITTGNFTQTNKMLLLK